MFWANSTGNGDLLAILANGISSVRLFDGSLDSPSILPPHVPNRHEARCRCAGTDRVDAVKDLLADSQISAAS